MAIRGIDHIDLAVTDVDFDVGIEHLAFTVGDPREVDAAYQRCLSMNARIHCPPEEESDIPGYYAFFVLDPRRDSNRGLSLV